MLGTVQNVIQQVRPVNCHNARASPRGEGSRRADVPASPKRPGIRIGKNE